MKGEIEFVLLGVGRAHLPAASLSATSERRGWRSTEVVHDGICNRVYL